MKKYALTAAAGGFLIDLLACWPGFMNVDSVDQYRQAVTGHYADWHPPAMAGFWSLLNVICSGPQLMLLFQLLLLWTSFYGIAITWCRRRPAFIGLILLFAGAPYIQNFAGVIVKDAQMALCWLLAAVILLRVRYQKRKMTPGEAVASFLLLTYGTMVRINALPGVFPLYYLWVEGIYTGPLVRKIGLFATALTGLFLIHLSVDKLILKPEKWYPEYKLMAHDIAGIYMATGHSYFPAFIAQYPGFDTNYIKTHFTTATFDNIWGITRPTGLFPPLDEEKRTALVEAWQNSILDNPFTYIKNRFDGFLYFLQLKQRPAVPFVYYYPEIYPNPYGLKLEQNWLRSGYVLFISANSGMPYMKPWFWLLLPVIQLLFTLRLATGFYKEAGFFLTASSLLYLLPQYFIYPVDTEFRYVYWCSIITSLHTVLLIARNYTKQPATDATGQPVIT